eukprot:CAMPEP_0172629612 /NCGR_PEP_ID=MMETSP1068-20121228/169029_1 /TAXON_ID=35684 /ORGANISM="Pseudopedinella elastica, Strain CCMP716" /LENGTH=79 /DNA_ID=CAMNT_0013440205 /DNA_START=272 /DNA_END=511 /DNA_ORIENTATION=+
MTDGKLLTDAHSLISSDDARLSDRTPELKASDSGRVSGRLPRHQKSTVKKHFRIEFKNWLTEALTAPLADLGRMASTCQ